MTGQRFRAFERVHDELAEPLDLDQVNDARSLAVLSVPPQSRVLDIGSGSGAVARALAARGCQVWGVDIDSTATRLAEPWCDGTLLGDVETADLDAFLGSERADVILFLDVLEHLRDPAAAIRRALPLLAPGGKMILAVPHVAHAAMRLQLLAGTFPGTSDGLLNRTNLHFFDRSSLQELFRHAGVRVIDEARIVRSVKESQIPLNLAVFPQEAIDLATTGPDAETYQFVVTVVPGTGTTVERMPRLVSTLTEHLHRSKQALALLRDDLRRSDLERRQSEEQLARTTSELERCQVERRFLRDDVLVKDTYLATLRQQSTQSRQAHAEIGALTERLDSLTAEHAAEVTRAADLALSNCDIREQLERARQELHRAHASIADTLAQPRYQVADRCNAWVRKAGFLHAALKRGWAARFRGR